MEEKQYISIPFATEEVKKERPDPLAATYPIWSTRWKCCQTYLCLSMSYLSVMKFCWSLTKYGIVILVPYLIFTAVLGAPGVLVEVLFGRYGGGNVLRTWSMCPAAKGLFICLFLMTSTLVIETNLLSVFVMKYLFSCLYGSIPWDSCNKEWAKDNCFEVGKKEHTYFRCLAAHSREYCNGLQWETSAAQYWKYVISSSKGLNILWNFICLTVSILIILAVVFKGFHSLEKTLALLVYPVFVFYGILGIVSLSIPNAVKGLVKLCNFGWGNISNLNLWTVGFFDALFSNCVGTLSLSFISGHGKFTDNILLDVFTVTFISFISCLIFTVPFLCAIKSITDVEEDNKINDTMDVIVIFSQAFLLYPIPKVAWTALYFLNAFFMSLSSQSILFLALAEALHNIFKKKSVKFWVLVISGVSFVLTVFFHLMKVRIYSDEGALSVNFLLSTLTWQLFYGIENFKNDFHFMMGFPVPLFIRCTWITLLIMPIIILTLKFYSQRKSWLQNITDFIFVGFFILIYIFNILYHMIQAKRRKEQVITVFTANPDWGPDNPLLKKSRKLFGISTITREYTYRQELNKKPLVKPPEFSDQNIVSLI